jgi:SH3 domain-containing YSC84-like protein 1
MRMTHQEAMPRRDLHTRTRGERGRGLVSLGVAVALLAVTACASTTPSTATNQSDDRRNAQDLVEKARMTVNNFLADQALGDAVRALLPRAKAVVVFPQELTAAFIIGASGGNGVAVARDAQNHWSGPAFYTLGGLSVGFQAGGEASEVLLVALTERGVAALQSTSAKLGADAGVAAGPVGLGAAAATANLSADIVSYVRNQGLYAGVAVTGAVVAVRTALNQAYYGRAVTPTDILISRTVSNPQAAGLLAEIRRNGSPAGTGGTSQTAPASAASVKQAQQALQAAGFDPGPIDGQLGPDTQAALQDFQQSKGLRVTGQLDPATQQALARVDRSHSLTGSGASGGTAAGTPNTQ